MVNQNKIFSFKIKRQAKNVFPRDVERTVATCITMTLYSPALHYENTPIQIYRKFHLQKLKIFG